jgi:hypothetical protein
MTFAVAKQGPKPEVGNLVQRPGSNTQKGRRNLRHLLDCFVEDGQNKVVIMQHRVNIRRSRQKYIVPSRSSASTVIVSHGGCYKLQKQSSCLAYVQERVPSAWPPRSPHGSHPTSQLPGELESLPSSAWCSSPQGCMSAYR